MSTEPGARHRAVDDDSATESAIRIVWIYPDLLSTYGDRGNMLILAWRADTAPESPEHVVDQLTGHVETDRQSLGHRSR